MYFNARIVLHTGHKLTYACHETQRPASSCHETQRPACFCCGMTKAHRSAVMVLPCVPGNWWPGPPAPYQGIAIAEVAGCRAYSTPVDVVASKHARCFRAQQSRSSRKRATTTWPSETPPWASTRSCPLSRVPFQSTMITTRGGWAEAAGCGLPWLSGQSNPCRRDKRPRLPWTKPELPCHSCKKCHSKNVTARM